MRNNSGIGVAAVALVLAVVGIGFSLSKPATQPSQPPLAAVNGPDSYFTCEKHNGIERCFTSKGLIQATSTVCAIQSPNSTSTLEVGAVRFKVATSSASFVTLAKSTTFNSTSTLLGAFALGAGAQGTFIASTTGQGVNGAVSALDPAPVFAPRTWFVVGIANGVTGGDTVGGGFVPVGSCQATFQSI